MLVESFSGIRGIYGKDLTGDIARRYAYVFHEFLKQKLERNPSIVVGMDTRDSSHMLKEAMFDPLFNIIDVGIMTTPGVEFAVRALKADAGIMVTGSHNEPEYNGFKFLDENGAVLSDSAEIIKRFHEIAELSEKDFLNNYLYKEKGPVKKIKNVDVKKGYFDFLLGILKNVDFKKVNFKVVLDPVGGTAIIAKELLEQLGVNVVCVNCNEGDFKRIIDPTEDSLSYLKDIIKKEKADFGVGFDLDGDRMEIMLEQGVISGNDILALLVDDVLSEVKDAENQVIVTNDATSQVVKKIVEKHGAKLKEVEVGEINVVNAIYASNSLIGGEGSCAGGIIPPSRCRDGILTLLFVLKMIAKRKEKLEEIVEELPVYYNLRKAIKFDAEEHDTIKKELKKHYSRHKMQETGGIKGGLKIIINKDSYIWFRASKTEGSIFRIIADSNDKEKAEKLLKEAAEFFKKKFK